MTNCDYIIISSGYDDRLYDREDWSDKQLELWEKINSKYLPVYFSASGKPVSEEIRDLQALAKLPAWRSHVIFKNLTDNGQFFGLFQSLKQLEYCDIYDTQDIKLLDGGRIVSIIYEAESG